MLDDFQVLEERTAHANVSVFVFVRMGRHDALEDLDQHVAIDGFVRAEMIWRRFHFCFARFSVLSKHFSPTSEGSFSASSPKRNSATVAISSAGREKEMRRAVAVSRFGR